MSNSKPTKSRRYRNFSLVTYLTDEQVFNILAEHNQQIKACSYITHDKDVTDDGELKEKHIHILLALYNNTTENAIKNWFNGGYVDNNGNIINTLVEKCNCIQAQFDYQIHKRNQDKYQYDISERKGWNFDYFVDTKSQDDDTLQQALIDCCNGVPLSILVQRYGRDFIIHYRTIKCLVSDIILEEKGHNPFLNDDTYIKDEKF